MALQKFSKRELIRLVAGLSAAFAGTRVSAQTTKMFGVDVPDELLKILPVKPLNLARTVDTVLRLERDADRKGLPQSILALGKGQPIAALDTSLYEMALPRLVAIIDRSELQDLGLAEEAGGLLAELHATQHQIPDALRGQGIGGRAPSPHSMILGLDPVQNEGRSILPDILPAPQTPPSPIPDVPAAPEPDIPLSRARDFASLKSEYSRLFSTATVRAEHAETANWYHTMITKSRSRYEAVSRDTVVPWYFIAVIHALESSCNFRAHLHNGDFPLTQRTRQVPSNRPSIWLPPADWESSARDALKLLGFTGQKDWGLERTLYRLEAYNGLGYRPYGVATPYLWSFSNHYERGKYVGDGKWSATARSQQCGAAVMLKLLNDAGDVKLTAGEPAP
jgi:lysozyme family protein